MPRKGPEKEVVLEVHEHYLKAFTTIFIKESYL